MTNTYYVAGIPFSSYNSLAHHGIKGQKWGVRRFQNPDGSLTEAGKKRYAAIETKAELKYVNRTAENSHWGKFISRDLAQKTNRINDTIRKSNLMKLDADAKEAYKKYTDARRKAWDEEELKRRSSFKNDAEYNAWRGSENYERSRDDFLNLISTVKRLEPLRSDREVKARAYNDKVREIASELVGSYGNKKVKDLRREVTVESLYRSAVKFALSEIEAEDDIRKKYGDSYLLFLN